MNHFRTSCESAASVTGVFTWELPVVALLGTAYPSCLGTKTCFLSTHLLQAVNSVALAQALEASWRTHLLPSTQGRSVGVLESTLTSLPALMTTTP